jgi:glycosyltransferase involved in cell wall biosynthesis
MKLPFAIDARFFSALHDESPQPLIVSGGEREHRKAVALFCSTAVVLGAAELELRFHWCGPVSAASAARLQAAGIGRSEEEAAVLPSLQAAWAYIACGGDSGFPLRLAQAMACALPCVAADLPAHRALIDDGVTGLLFRHPEEAQQLLGVLIDDAGLRRRLGRGARHAALRRFGPTAAPAGVPPPHPVAAALPLLPQRATDG